MKVHIVLALLLVGAAGEVIIGIVPLHQSS